MNFYYDKKVISDIDKAIPMYGMKEFESPCRSTVPLLSWLKHEIPMLDSLLKELGMPEVCNLHLEYTVAPQRGKGVASHTDLMVRQQGCALAVEAKWTEPRYDTVSKWLMKGSNPQNRKDVLNGWLDLLQKHALRELLIEDFSAAIYQMVHRAASACAAESKPKLAYLVFKPSPDPRAADTQTICADLAHLWSLLGSPQGFHFYVVELSLSPTAAFKPIKPKEIGKHGTAMQVRAALSGNNRLFSFEKYSVTRVGTKA
ncbi:MAG: hypothetical protein ABSH41_18985 [Syntrophobacteraceae bacterium]|jgi:hypothetical protein